VEEEIRPGYYKDVNGDWQKDRRRTDRRATHIRFHHHDRRQYYRRKTDMHILEREAKHDIEDALENFAAHGSNGESEQD
jgi:hypothetical protein